MAPFKFIHAADLHLDSPFRGLSCAGVLLPVFQRSTFEAFRRLVSLCLREKVSFLLLAGDLFELKDRSVRARLFLSAELARLESAGIATFIVHGNHDPLSGAKGSALPPSTVVFTEQWAEHVVRSAEGRVLCRVQGISYPDERVSENLSRHFSRQGPEFTIGLMHANLGGDAGHANYAPCTLADLAARQLDYWALGHVHTRAEYPLESGGVAVYPGNPQGRHINEDGARGCVLVEVDGQRSRRTFVPLDCVRWHRVPLDIAGFDSIEALHALSEDAICATTASAGEGFEAHAVRLVLEGRGALHSELCRPGVVDQLHERLSEQLGARIPPVFLEAVKDKTEPAVDLDRVVAAGGLVAELVAEGARAVDPGFLDELYGEDELRRLEAALLQAGLSGTRGQAQAHVQQATLRAVERLLSEEAP